MSKLFYGASPPSEIISAETSLVVTSSSGKADKTVGVRRGGIYKTASESVEDITLPSKLPILRTALSEMNCPATVISPPRNEVCFNDAVKAAEASA